jgi:2-oxoglutarate ferredoxin oxidoreductase subunit gamma
MAERYEIILAGEGGQGLLLAGLILAEAAAIYDGKNAVQTQSYGPEVRGGISKSEVVIGDGEIDYPKVLKADLILVMSQRACDKYYHYLKKGGLFIVDSDGVQRVPTSKAYRLPITRLAQESTGQAITANVVALGLLVRLSGAVSEKAIEKAVMARAPRGTEAINRRALEVGLQVAGEFV